MIAPTFSSTRRDCARTSPSTNPPVVGSTGICPETNRKSPARMAWEYGPMAAGAAWVETACGIRSGSLYDLAGTQAPSAHAQPLGSAVDRRTDRLEVRLEPPSGHVVRVADIVPRDGPLAADFTPLRHGCFPAGKRRPSGHYPWRAVNTQAPDSVSYTH